MAESNLYERYNYDDVFNRCVIAGLLDLMNNKISYDQIWENNIVEKVTVPCAYETGSSDERFMQDNYTFFGRACFGDKKIDGKFDMLPRCYIKYTGSQIDASSITNRFVKGTYLKNENGKLVSYTSYLYSIPLTFNFDCELFADNIITAFKIESAIREAFYKNKTYNVIYKGMRISCCAGFPEQTTIDKTVSYAFDAERQIKLTFNLAVEAYQPVFDSAMELPSETRIENIGYDVEHFVGVTFSLNGERMKNNVKLKLNPIDSTVPIPSGTNLYISWECTSMISDICSVIISYVDNDTNEEHVIETPSINQKYYIWSIPESFTNYTSPDIAYILDEDSPVTIYEEPRFKIIPNNKDEIVESSFILIEEGSIKSTQDGSVMMMLSYLDKKGNTQISDSYWLNIVNGKLDKTNPVTLDGTPMKYENDIQKRNISIKISYPLDMDIFDKTDNLLIV
jgi:hypothetical protein